MTVAAKIKNFCRGLSAKRRGILNCRLDAPGPREVRPGRLNAFSGWVCVLQDRPVSAVEIYQDNSLLGTCECGLEREDVHRAHPDCPQARHSGFFGWIAIPADASGSVRVVAVDPKGKRYTIGRRRLARHPGARRFFLRTGPPAAAAGGTSTNRSDGKSYIPRQILIAGLAKTGTTGLFFKIGNSLAAAGRPGARTKILFEPAAYSGPEDQRVLAKILISKKNALTLWGDGRQLRWSDFEGFRGFDKKILLHRDPRDRLISSLLYSTQNRAFKKHREHLLAFLDLLERKERDPGAVSLLELLSVRLRGGNYSLQQWADGLKDTLGYFLEFRRHHTGFFHYRYEDFVRGDTKCLEEFLGFALAGDADVERGLERVVRTKKSGDWKNWFTEQDISFFRPVFEHYMIETGYAADWALPERQKIPHAYGAAYVEKITRA